MSRSLFLILLVLAFFGPGILQARSLPEGQSHRFVRRRISPHDPDLEIIEVKEVYYVRRPKKVVVPLDEDELDRRIRCDFEPSLAECRDLTKKPVAPKRLPTTTTTTTTTEAPTTSTTTTRRTTTTTTQEPLRDESMERSIRCEFDPTAEECTPSTTSTTTTTTTTTTTELPPLPELKEPEVETEEEPQDYVDPEIDSESGKEEVTEEIPEEVTEETTEKFPEESPEEVTEEIVEEPNPDDDIALAEDDGEGDDDDETEDPEDQEDEADLEDMYDANPNPGETHSIGAHDGGTWNYSQN
ncbi:PH domain-containing protein DDB_G0287875 [Drosophila takahashii]|uniref:PH domain-containing protein DDB_G0287875 n=1 Tax=Drosophila takahashii TaxID=29030 RepID=UPI001CF8E9EF|nr:myb-like protein X [Drosophila takahashii]